MPRVTRRSLAAAEGKDEKTEPQPQPSRSRGRRGAKNVEPEEAASVDEPQESPAKPGRRGGRAKETTPKEEAPRGRASSRSGARGKGKAEPEPAEDVEEETEEKEEKASSKRASRGRGRGRGRGKPPGRSSRGRVEEEEAEEEEMEEEDDSSKSVEPPKPASGSRSRGRGKAAAEVEAKEPEEVKEDVKTTPRGRQRKTPTKAPESEPSPPSGGRRQSGRRGQAVEDVTPKKTPTPERSSRRKTESPPDSSKAKDKAAVEPESTSKDEQEKSTKEDEKVEEAMVKEDEQAEKATVKEDKTEEAVVKEDKTAEEAMETEEPQAQAETSSETTSKKEEKVKDVAVGGQKRKHEDEEEPDVSDGNLKRARLSATSPAAPAVAEVPKEDTKDLSDFVVVSKEDVPAADSQEVADALPPVKKAEERKEKAVMQEKREAEASERSEEPGEMEVTQSEESPPKEDKAEEEKVLTESETTKEAQAMEVQEDKQEEEKRQEAPTSDSKEAPVQMTTDAISAQTVATETSTPEVPVVVPLTEAELAKQYNPTVRDRDETSSTLVEVGSEAASDVMSTRNLDVSDAISMDATTSELTNEESNLSSDSHATSEKNADPAPVPTAVGDDTSKNSLCDIPLPPQSSDAAPAPVNNSSTPQQPVSELSLNSIPLPPSFAVASAVSQSSTPSPAPSAITTPITNATQNGNIQSSDPVQSVPLHTSTPAKRPSYASLEGYVPSSTSIDKRKLIINPNFPIELFDTAFCFSVVSYNILADCHMRRSDYSYTEPKYLDQSYRHNLMTQELEYLDGDIVCMQEVNPAYYNDTLLPFMKSKGYQGVFMKRTKEWYDEGEATFVKTSKFEILSHQGLSLKDLAYKEIDSGGLSEEVARAAEKYLDRADVILLCKLLSKKTGKTLTLCNIHVVWDMPSPDVQCIQVACAIKELVSMAGSDLNPYIICGDFNSEVTSPAYHLAKEGYLSDAHIRSLQALGKMDNTDGSSRSLINHLWRAFQHTSSNLKSAYETAVGKEPALTSFTKITHAAYDYIFFSASSLHAVGALEVIDQQVLEANGGLPSKTIPSDHVSMKAMFRLKD